MVCDGTHYCHLNLKVLGRHNALNALAAAGTAWLLGIDGQAVADGLATFTGAYRRLQYKGSFNGAEVYDDYAHHPTEIASTLDTASQMEHDRIFCVFQPHTYSRTKELFDDFAHSLSHKGIHQVILAEIYSARETDTLGVSSSLLAQAVCARGGNCISLSDNGEIVAHLKAECKQGDIILVAYLLALSRVAIVLAALDTGSSFEGMGAAREALYGALVEPALMVGLATLALFCGDTSFAEIFATTQHLDLNLTVVLLLVAYIFVMILFIEAGRVPVDDPKTHLELTMIHEVMCLDYSGIDLGMIQIAGWLKNSIFAIIAANAISVAFCFHWWFAVPLAVLGTGMAVGIVESLRARNKLSRNPTYILTIGILAALVLLIGFLLFNQENLGL